MDTKGGLGRIAAAGLSVAAAGLVAIRLLMDNAGEVYSFMLSMGMNAHVSMGLMMFSTFSPLWLGGLIGWVVAAGGASARPKQRAAAAAALTVPIALMDPWAIVALGFGDVFFPLKLIFLSAPVFIAAVFAYPGRPESRFRLAAAGKNILLLISVTVAIYVIIYWLILPSGNVTAIPLVQR